MRFDFHRLLRLTACVAAGLTLAFEPYILRFDHAGGFKVALAAAHAKDGNNGNGNGGNRNGNGNANGSGNGKGNSGNSGESGNAGKGNSNGNNQGESGESGGGGTAGNNNVSNSGRGTSVNHATGDKVTVQGNTIEVVHPDGISEKIEAGRFKMKDALGRTIIDRAAKAADVRRLRGL
jgi:hypothetical protein